jgi:alpha-methylacyl-CoA racemase
MAVGSLEPQFYAQLMMGLGLSHDDKFIEQFSDFNDGKKRISEIFLSKTQNEWVEIFDKLDACVTPVLEMEEAPLHPLNLERGAFVQNKENGHWEPKPAPLLSRTPGQPKNLRDPEVGEHSIEVLKETGFNVDEIEKLIKSGAVGVLENKSKL